MCMKMQKQFNYFMDGSTKSKYVKKKKKLMYKEKTSKYQNI